MYDYYEGIVHWLLMSLGHTLNVQGPLWAHSVLHLTVFWAPLTTLVFIIVASAIKLQKKNILNNTNLRKVFTPESPTFGSNVFLFILKHTFRQQLFLTSLGLIAMPILYLTLELPKIIINDVINSTTFPVFILTKYFSQNELLFTLSAVFLGAVSIGGSLKYTINVYKGKVGERILRRLRLSIYRSWRTGRGSKRRSEIIPLIVQEVEPIGGFASDSFSLPVFQGGTFVTILFFMFMQDPVLGTAALTLLPVQIFLIPKLQRRINSLARLRVIEIRSLSGELGDQSSHHERNRAEILIIGSLLRRVEDIRQNIHRIKFLMKAINNFLTALTPFLFYSIGGYLVIENQLTIGALVAVIAAQKEFSSPLRELFKYYQNAADVTVRFNEVTKFLDLKIEGNSNVETDAFVKHYSKTN